MMRRTFGLAASALLLALCSGCMQIDTLVQLHEDSSATITEKVRFSKRLLDLGEKAGPDLDIAKFLTKEAASQRMASMGEGIQMTSHEVKEVEGGARESVAVYKIPDINNFRYISPFLAYADYPDNNAMKLTLSPIYQRDFGRNDAAGKMTVNFEPVKPAKSQPRPKEGEPPPKGPTPAELQVIRDLRPIFQDILKDFKLKLTFESYATIWATGFGHRGARAGTHRADLINFSDKDLDNFGSVFIENEEIMVDLLRWDVGSKNVCEHVKNFTNNLTLPIFLPRGSPNAWYGVGSEVLFAPSRPMFDKHFAGKKLTFVYDRSPNRTRDASWDEIGWKGGGGKAKAGGGE